MADKIVFNKETLAKIWQSITEFDRWLNEPKKPQYVPPDRYNSRTLAQNSA